jgi:DNA-binding NarL/FixJ family response regulator
VTSARPGIGGRLDLEALATLAGREKHRPQTREEMRAAVHELASRGYTNHSIAHATGLSVEAVRKMLGEAQG